MRPRPKGFSLYAYIASLFVALLFAFAAVTITSQYIQTRNMLLVSAGALFERVGEQTRQGLGRITEPAILSVRLLSRTRLVTAKTEAARLDAAPLLIETLESGRQLSAAYVGYDDGDFIAIRPIDPDSTFGRALSPPSGSAYLIQSITHDETGQRSGRYLFFDKDLRLLLNGRCRTTPTIRGSAAGSRRRSRAKTPS